MRHTIRSKLVLFTVLPVLAVYSMLLWLGVSWVRDHLGADAQRWSIEHARHQASRLALTLSQVPALAGSLADLVVADPDQPQALLYAHLIDGLRRTPVANSAAVAYGPPARGAVMRRGALAGAELSDKDMAVRRAAGWQLAGDMLRFVRPIRHQGEQIGDAWVELAVADAYAEIGRQKAPAVTLLLSDSDGSLLQPIDGGSEVEALSAALPRDLRVDEVRSVQIDSLGSAYWLVSSELPGLPWRITAATRAETALQPVQREVMFVALGLLLSLMAIVVIIGIVARQITRPLQTLDASVHKVAQGNFAVSPNVASDDELGRLARTIQRMAGHIAKRETQLRDSQQILEQRVAERTSALQQSNARLIRQIEATRATQEALRIANDQAQQASRAKSEFLSNMSHELRTPLHGVLGYAQILRRDAATSPTQRESLEAIERCGQHLLTLINDILDMAKIEAGQMQVDIRPTDLTQLLEDVRLIVAQRARSKGLDLKLVIDDALPDRIRTDPVKLKQILLNLLGNAVKFTHRGSVTLCAGLGGTDRLVFEVDDTGVGIPADRIAVIFDAFHQAREGQAVDGTGLGLAINQRLIGLLGGEALSVDSQQGVGSRFRFSIPYQAVAEDERADRAGDPTHHAGATAAERPDACAVMVVDPLAENRKLVSALLDHAHCEVEACADRDAALQRLAARAFDLVLLDTRLPDANAADTVARFRHAVTAGSPRLVATSANVFLGAERLARQAGFDAFLAKPFNEQQLFGLIETLRAEHHDGQRSVDARDGARTPIGEWPPALAVKTAQRVRAAIDLGDVGSLFELAEDLADDAAAPAADVENLALMARMFDFDGLRQLADRLAGGRHRANLTA